MSDKVGTLDWPAIVNAGATVATALVAMIALMWAIRTFGAADKQAATGVARAFRDQVVELEGLILAMDAARQDASMIMQNVRAFTSWRNISPNAAAVQLGIIVDKFNDSRIRLKERSEYVKSPTQDAFDEAASNFQSSAGTAVLQAELFGRGQPQPQIDPRIPDFPHGTIDVLDGLYSKFVEASMELRREILDDTIRARREISRHMQKAISG